MNKIEQKIYSKYKREISKIVRSKYKKRAYDEARIKKIYFVSGDNVRKRVNELSKQIYETYLPIIDEEIEIRLSEFLKSQKFLEAVKAEKEIQKKKLSYKSLKKYQEFDIGISNTLLDKIFEEVNSDGGNEVSKEEIKYILLSVFYKIIEYMQNGFKVKIGTLIKLWLVKRDVRINLPDVHNRILEDRLIPKAELCSSFGYNLFHQINKDNEAIMNYYKAKMERFLMLLKGNKQ